MKIDPQVAALVQELTTLGAVSLRVSDDAAMSEKSAEHFRKYLESLNSESRAADAELLAKEFAGDRSTSFEIEAVCPLNLLSACLDALSRFGLAREREMHATARSLDRSVAWVSEGGTAFDIHVTPWVDNTNGGTEALPVVAESWESSPYRLTLTTTVWSAEAFVYAPDPLPERASLRERVAHWWNT